MTFKYLALVAALVLLAACETTPPPPQRPANVQSTGSIDQRQREMEARLEQSYKAGRLSAQDYRMLKSRADEIRRDERRSTADRTLTLDEQKRLHTMLDSLSSDIDRFSNRR